VRLLVSPAAFFRTTFAFTANFLLRFSCLRAGLFSLTLTVALRVLPILNVLRPTVLTRAAVMIFAVRVSKPVVRASPFTTIVTTPLLLTDTFPKRGLPGRIGGGGGGGGWFGIASDASIAPTASTTPPVTVTPAIPATGFAPFLRACTI